MLGMIQMYLSAITIAFLSTPICVFAEPLQLSAATIMSHLERFVAEPHPMGSAAQKKLARDWRRELNSQGWQVTLQSFRPKVPNVEHVKFGGKSSKGNLWTSVDGINIIATRPGTQSCTVLIGGHYDTKFFREFKFVGANDGGSSSALMMELARVLNPKKVLPNKVLTPKSNVSRWIDCSLMLVFFDGEEAFLPEWYQAQQDPAFQKIGGLQDNLYGSRSFVTSFLPGDKMLNKKPLALAIIIDMIGHKDQSISITAGSHMGAAEQILAVKRDVLIGHRAEVIQDDHIPLQSVGIPIVHMIDWTNIQDHWHKPHDNLAVVSAQKIANFGNVLLDFLLLPRK